MNRKAKTQSIISIIFLSLVALMALSFCIVLLLRNANLRKEEEAMQSELEALNEEGYYTTSETQILIDAAKNEAEETGKESILELMQSKLENGDSTISTIRSVFTDQLVVADNGRYYFFPITDEIEHHAFGSEDFAINDYADDTGDDWIGYHRS